MAEKLAELKQKGGSSSGGNALDGRYLLGALSPNYGTIVSGTTISKTFNRGYTGVFDTTNFSSASFVSTSGAFGAQEFNYFLINSDGTITVYTGAVGKNSPVTIDVSNADMLVIAAYTGNASHTATITFT